MVLSVASFAVLSVEGPLWRDHIRVRPHQADIKHANGAVRPSLICEAVIMKIYNYLLA